MSLIRIWRGPDVDRVRPKPSIYSPEETSDWSTAAVAAWVLGIAFVLVVCFRYAGLGVAVETPVAPPVVPPTLRYVPTTPAETEALAHAGLTRARIAVESEARSRVTAVIDPNASYADGKFQYVIGRVVNASRIPLRAWKATLRFYDSGGREIDHRDTKSTKPILPGKFRGFKIRHRLLPGAARANLVLHGVEFKQ